MSSVKPLLIVLAIGLAVGLLMLWTIPSETSFDIGAYFERHVDACMEDHPDWARLDCERIVRGEIWSGMTSDMLRASLGEPRRIRRPREDDPTYEIWTYVSATYGEEEMVLREERLEGWEQIPCDSCAAKPPRK